MFRKIVSGGQTGVDRAALDFAFANGIEHGGWCPKGRLAEDGELPDRYCLCETPGSDYRQRTAWNVRDSDGTLILVNRELAGGTLYTLECARKKGKPVMVFSFTEGTAVQEVVAWLEKSGIRVLNVAGPRASSEPAIYAMTMELLRKIYRLGKRRIPGGS